MPARKLLIAFDLEGPLSPNDNAYELMSLFPGGDRLFEVISRYDDLLTLQGRPSYEPGDTLALIVPFLVQHSIHQKDIQRLAEAASLNQGAKELIARLLQQGWRVCLITTTYMPYARILASRLGIPEAGVMGTVLSLDYYQKALSTDILAMVDKVEREISSLRPYEDDQAIKERLDSFFWGVERELARCWQETKPMGGRRKLVALRHLALSSQCLLEEVVTVGDSITDFRMLESVEQAGGLAIAFNANQYALPYATVGLASENIHDLWPILEAWAQGGRPAVEAVVKAQERAGGYGNREHFHWLAGRKDLPQELHLRLRRLLRARAAELG